MEWRGFELHAETPPGGMPLADLYPAPMVREFQEHMKTFAAGFGIRDMHFSDHVSSTRTALAVTEYAREQGRLREFREAAMEASYRHGLDLEDREVLGDLARTAGLDPEAAVAAAADDMYLGRVDALRAEAQEMGVTGIPTFFFGDQPPVVGCEPYEVLARVAERAGAVRR